MKELPYCGICKEQIVNAPSIGWYCPTIGCEGDWPQKAEIAWDYKTEADKMAVAEKEIAELKKKRSKGEINEAYAATIERQADNINMLSQKVNKLQQKITKRNKLFDGCKFSLGAQHKINDSLNVEIKDLQNRYAESSMLFQKDIKDLADALSEAATYAHYNSKVTEGKWIDMQQLANKHLEYFKNQPITTDLKHAIKRG